MLLAISFCAGFGFMKYSRLCILVCAVLFCAVSIGSADGDPDEVVTLNFPENVELKVLADYVGKRLDINILYDEQINNKKVTLKAPKQIPVDSLMGLLESALKLKGLALIDAEQPGWKKIVQVRNLAEIAAPPPEDGGAPIAEDVGATVAVTRVFELAFASPQRVDQLIKPYLTPSGGNSFQVPEHRMLIVTDFATNMRRIERLITVIDREPQEAATKFIPAKNMTAQELAQQVSQVLTARAKAQGGAVQGGSGRAGLDVLHNERTNQVILIGPPEAVEQASKLVTSLDVGLGLETRMYTFTSASPERVDRLIKQLIGEVDAKRLYKSAIDKESNTLIVTTTDAIHTRVVSMKDDFDKVVAVESSPIRFYSLKNAVAADVLETIRSIDGDQGLRGLSVSGSGDGARQRDLLKVPGTSGPNTPSTPGATPREGEGLPRPPGYRPSETNNGSDSPSAAPQPIASRGPVVTDDARVMADTETNSIIVVGPPDAQRIYAQLIERLDKRRPQVLLEVTVATLDTSGGYSFGIDVARSQDVADGKLITVGSFGVSDVDGDTGRLTLTPGLGFNGALISADIADIIVRALQTNSRAKVVSAPKILVNDHATGTLTSVSEAPFTSVNASDTVATTSFAGFASAGTTINMTPHIAEGDHLQLEYTIDLSSFTGDGSETVPPPRQTNAISSNVTIPDGSTIIVGGLTRKDLSNSRSTIPLIGDIPLLGDLIGSTTKSETESTLFVFIRPVILRDDRFRDLKFYSTRDVKRAELPDDLPSSQPLLIE